MKLLKGELINSMTLNRHHCVEGGGGKLKHEKGTHAPAKSI